MPSPATMPARLRLPLALLLALAAAPALAAVLAEGQPKGGFYWQKIQKSNGIQYLCRSQSDAKIQKSATCTTAGAPKP
jgi:hypothetical protein